MTDAEPRGATVQALFIHKSMYGNTHLIADAIAAGLNDQGIETATVPVGDANPLASATTVASQSTAESR